MFTLLNGIVVFFSHYFETYYLRMFLVIECRRDFRDPLNKVVITYTDASCVSHTLNEER